MGILLTSSSSGNWGVTILLWVAIMVGFYFLLIAPQKKERKRVATMIAQMEVGDTVVTTSGFYGVIIDIADDDVVIEFGNNKNCRIPMQKQAIAQIEKQGGAAENPAKSDKPSKTE